MDPLGKSPIPVPLLILGKAAMAGSLLFFALKRTVAGALVFESALVQIIGIVLAGVGALVVILGFVSLGSSVSVGLPREKTRLRTHGVFRMTRNPLYFGAFLACIGSCLYAPHIVNFILCALTMVIHHRVVLKEEEWLEKQFGPKWLDYRRRVRRYVGWRGSADD
jgi:protein-S-isoprenylcysteine O-methyltransferase Ste14